MRDPIVAPPLLVKLATPVAEKLGLETLPYHIHEILIGFLCYHFVLNIASPTLSRAILPSTYHAFNKRTKLNWDIHVVSMVQALFINTAALYVIFQDPGRGSLDWRGRLWGYTPASGMVQGFAAGYFLWDLQVSAQYMHLSGLSALLHAIGALAVTCIGFKPFANYYGLSFVLYELSTPFLNIHWFCDKLNMTGSKLQLYNGILLLLSFFACRLIWGTYQSILIYTDIYTALITSPSSPMVVSRWDGGACEGNTSGLDVTRANACEVGELPLWLISVYLIGNTALSFLNVYWFTQMVKAVKKRFAPVGRKEGDYAIKKSL